MITTRAEAEALHAAIEARDDAWNRFHNAALMPAHQTPDDRLAATANNWIAADAQVRELAHGVGIPQIPTTMLPATEEVPAQETASATTTVKAPAKRRGRPPKAKAPEEKAATPGAAADTGAQVAEPGAQRTEEEVRAEAEGAGAPGPAEATDADAGGDGAAA